MTRVRSLLFGKKKYTHTVYHRNHRSKKNRFKKDGSRAWGVIKRQRREKLEKLRLRDAGWLSPGTKA